MVEDFLYRPPDPAYALGKTATFALGNKTKNNDVDELKTEILRKLREKVSGIYAGFKFFDVRQSGVLTSTDFFQGVQKLGIKADFQSIESLLSPFSPRNELNLESFCELFREGAVSLTPSPRPFPSPMLNIEEGKSFYRKKQTLPSDRDPLHCYGKGNRPSDSIRDVLEYSFQREFILQKLQKDQSRSLSPTGRRKYHTKTTQLRLKQLQVKTDMSPLRPRKLPSLSATTVPQG